MMKIGVIADTHSREIPKKVMDDLKKMNMVIHAGDFCSVSDYELVKKVNKEFKAVYGNMDEPKLRRKLPEVEIFKVEEITIGLYHGEGAAGQVVDSVIKKLKDLPIDVAIFGHSHHPMNEYKEGILYFNPGSPNDLVIAPYCSYGILEIKGKSIKTKIVKVKA